MTDQSSDKELIERLRIPDTRKKVEEIDKDLIERLRIPTPNRRLTVFEIIVAERDATGRELVWLRADLIKIAEALGILNERSNREHIEDAETKSFGYWRELASQITDAAASIRNGRV
jgi:hypothetical protein